MAGAGQTVFQPADSWTLPAPPKKSVLLTASHQQQSTSLFRGRSSTVAGTSFRAQISARQHSFDASRQGLYSLSNVSASALLAHSSETRLQDRTTLTQKLKRFLNPSRSRTNLKGEKSATPPLPNLPPSLNARLEPRGGDSNRRIRSDPPVLQSANSRPPRTSDASFVTAPEARLSSETASRLPVVRPMSPEEADYSQLNRLRLRSLAALQTGSSRPDSGKASTESSAASVSQARNLEDIDVQALRRKTIDYIAHLKKSNNDFASILTSMVMFQKKSERATVLRCAERRRQEAAATARSQAQETSIDAVLAPDVGLCDSRSAATAVHATNAVSKKNAVHVGNLRLGPASNDASEMSSDHQAAATVSQDNAVLSVQTRRSLRKSSEEKQRNRKSTVVEARCYTASTTTHDPLPDHASSIGSTPSSPWRQFARDAERPSFSSTVSSPLTIQTSKFVPKDPVASAGPPVPDKGQDSPSEDRGSGTNFGRHARGVGSNSGGKSDCSVIFV